MRGKVSGKHGKTRKTRKSTSRKLLVWNTIEQYAGLKSAAASSFFDISCRNIKKDQNRHFLESEQYAGLESARDRNLSVPVSSGGQE